MRRRINGSDWLAAAAAVLAAGWVVAWATGAHPDDALLAFAGTLLVVWASREKDQRQREDVGGRDRGGRELREDDSE